jgi:crotonobetainyl-CoA:carnitine CoA-transferase CaiB-like acyl-CoA transferase
VPVKTGISSADLMGAEMAALAVLAALEYRDRTGRGQYVDLSMQDIAAWMTQTVWNAASPAQSKVRAIRCNDGFIVTRARDDELRKLSDIVPRTPSGAPESKLARHDVSQRLAQRGIAAAPVLSVHEMMAAPQTASRNLWFPVTENGETWPLLASPLRLLGTPASVRRPMPTLGADTAAIRAALHRSTAPATAAS